MKFTDLFHRSTACAAVLAALAFGSCIKDQTTTEPCPPDPNHPDNRMTFVIRVPQSSVPVTRAIAEGQAADNDVQTITVLLFATSDDGTGLYQGYADATLPDASTTATKTFSVVLPDGEYDLLIAANATQILTDFGIYDPSKASALAGMTQQDFERRMTLTLPEKTPWNAATGSYTPFPMAGRYHLTDARDPTATYGPISLLRMLAKVNVTMNTIDDKGAIETSLQSAALREIMLCNYNRTGRLAGADWTNSVAPSVFDLVPDLPDDPHPVTGIDNALDFKNLGDAVSSASEPINVTGTAPNWNWACRDEIFIPEVAVPADASDWKDATCLLIRIYMPSAGADRWFRVNFRLPRTTGAEPEPVNLMRNFRYTVNIKAITANGFATAAEAYNSMPEGMTTDITAIDDSRLDDVTYDGRNQLAVNESVFVFPAESGAGQELDLSSDYDASYQWSVDDPTGTWFHLSQSSGAANVPAATTLSCDDYTGNTVRFGSFIINVGALRKTVYVIQVPPTANITDSHVPQGMIPYVGAFWRNNQTGERLIDIARPATGTAADGGWTAIVVEGKDWIQLDTDPSADPNINTDSPDSYELSSDFDSKYQVVSKQTWVADTLDANRPQIYFRVGLNTQYTPTATNPARYGLILLAYNNYTKLQRIWVRQGEEADYLFRPEDLTPAGDPRPNAVRISPYNLTGQGLPGGTTESVQVPLQADGGGIFTAYPSQQGAFFEWGGLNYPRYAYNPISATLTTGLWDATKIPITTFWDNISATDETCPAGYRRITDGPTDRMSSTAEDSASSELRQSLFTTPPTMVPYTDSSQTVAPDNMCWGYYADGFFDRRTIGTTTAVTNASNKLNAVSWTTNDIAHNGCLIFNPTTCSSLFFPAGGFRGTNGGALKLGDGEYLTASKGPSTGNGSTQVRDFEFKQPDTATALTFTLTTTGSTNNGWSVRCVKD